LAFFEQNKRTLRILFLAAVGLLILFFGYYLSNVFNPFIIAFFLAYMLNPLVQYFEKKGVPRSVTAVGIVALLLGSIFLFLILVVPEISRQAANLPAAIVGDQLYKKGELKVDLNGNGKFDPGDAYARNGELKLDWNNDGVYDKGYIDKVRDAFANLTKSMGREIKLADNDQIYDLVLDNFGGPEEIAKQSLSILNWILNQALSVLNILIIFALIPIYLFYLIKEMNNIESAIKDHLPGLYRDRITDIWRQIHQAIAGFFRGRLVIAIICTLLILPVLIFCDVRFGVLIALLTGAVIIVPYLWIPFGLLPACIFILFDYPGDYVRFFVVAGAFIVVANLDQFILTPRIVGRKVELHPITIFLSMFVFGTLFGFFGIMLAVPLAAILKILAKELVLPELKALARETRPQQSAAGGADLRDNKPSEPPKS
jgi:predicted PurR-regulated permease PerM